MATLPLFDPIGPDRLPHQSPTPPEVLQVGQLNRMVRVNLEDDWPDFWVEGELADVHIAGSGHVYFTLQDPKEPAQVRAAMFRSDVIRSKVTLENGRCIRFRGHLSLYEPRGTFQFIARVAVDTKDGDKQQRLQQLKDKLAKEGIFSAERKRPLPSYPQVVAVVTSPKGAALFDIIKVARHRAPVKIVVVPCSVQGQNAADEIERGIALAQRLTDLDVVIVARGGGSEEDLAAYNQEKVVRAVAACRVPVVSAVGHEIDVSLTDLAADARAATPSNGAEMVVPDALQLLTLLDQKKHRLTRAIEVELGRKRIGLERQRAGIRDPQRALSTIRARLIRAEHRLSTLIRGKIQFSRHALQQRQAELKTQDPQRSLFQRRVLLRSLQRRLNTSLRWRLGRARQLMQQQHRALSSLSPLDILKRGYAIALDSKGTVVKQARKVKPGDKVQIRLHQGMIHTQVTDIIPPREQS